jgi:hypothetical protein
MLLFCIRKNKLLAIFLLTWVNVDDKFGRKPMFLRVSLGIAVIIACIGLAIGDSIGDMFELEPVFFITGALLLVVFTQLFYL